MQLSVSLGYHLGRTGTSQKYDSLGPEGSGTTLFELDICQLQRLRRSWQGFRGSCQLDWSSRLVSCLYTFRYFSGTARTGNIPLNDIAHAGFLLRASSLTNATRTCARFCRPEAASRLARVVLPP